MVGGGAAPETSIFSKFILDDVFSPEAKKIVAVYTRRAKKTHPQASESDKRNELSTSPVAEKDFFVFRDEGIASRIVRPKKKKSWYNRSLSFRGRRSSLLSTDRQPLATISSNLVVDVVTASCRQERSSGEADGAVVLTGRTRRTWAGVPVAYVKEQQAFFADIDAFNLDSREDSYSPSPRKPQVRASLEPPTAEDHPDSFFSRNGRVPFVRKNDSAISTSESSYDLLSAALLTPRPTILKSECKNNAVLVPPGSIVNPSDGFKRISFRVPSSCVSLSNNVIVDNQILASPETLCDRGLKRSSQHSLGVLGQGRRSSQGQRSSLARRSRSLSNTTGKSATSIDIFASEETASFGFDTDTLLSRLETLQIREEEDEEELNRPSLCTPILEEEAEEERDWLGGVSEEDVVDNEVVDLEVVEQVEPEQLLSVFDTLLKECGQERILTLNEAISDFSNMVELKKLGEGTFGEAFKGSGNVFKIVPMDGNFQVNGEHQKTSAEMFSEVVLSNTLNKLRGDPMNESLNMCTAFIETKATRICQGCYDPELVRAWEDWDAGNSSENDHPMVFPENQLYVVFVLADGGRDLESFVLVNFNEARSLLLQVVLALAVAEEVCQFEHRDLHWGNIVLARNREDSVAFQLRGQNKIVKSLGLSLSLIDFTLSRLDTGKQVLFCNLAADPAIFEGPAGDVQADTYRRMQKVTKGQWEGRFLKTNCLWIHYVADILLTKKAFSCSPQDKRSLRGFRKRVLLYESAGAAVQDDFFNGMWADL